jgi:hypothetical protein
MRRLSAGVDAGQLRGDADLEAVADALTGALLYQLLTGSAAASEQRAAGLFDVVMRGLQPAATDSVSDGTAHR